VTGSELPGRNCARDGCQNTFTPKRSDARYCSDACRALASRNRNETKRSDNRPARLSAAAASRPPVPPTWEPPSASRGAWQVNEPCPHCGEQLHTTGRATVRVCIFTCKGRVVPQGVTAPYQRGGELVRQVRSQRERDLDAISLAYHKGVMLGQLAALANDKRLHPESMPIVEWFAEQVRAARSGERLTELADVLPESGIRLWDGGPAAIEPPGYDDEDQDEDDEDDEDSYGAPGYPDDYGGLPAAKPPPPDYSSELAVREWVFRPHGVGICGLVHLKPHGWEGLPPEECINRAKHLIAGGAVCDSCFHAINYKMGGR